MKPVELGVLEQVGLRAAWGHEAQAFTPWLAEHLDRLSAVIGIPLELEGREVAVETFSADVLARNPTDDSLVLIENQLEEADHRHLGQLLTYLAGLGAQTVIWIAADFREAHLSAIKWLNDHTADPFAFFAVKVKVVRIGDSPLAPVFEVLARPNAWDRKLQAIAQESRQISELGQFRRDFWAHVVGRHPELGPLREGYAASGFRRIIKPFDVAIVLYVGRDSVGVFVRGERGSETSEIYERLASFADRLAERLGVPLGDPDGKYLLSKKLEVDTSDTANWDRMADWLSEQARLYDDALRGNLGAEP